MLDFLMISTRTRKGVVEIYPKFIIKKQQRFNDSRRGFLCNMAGRSGMWSTNEEDVIYLIDSLLITIIEKTNQNLKAIMYEYNICGMQKLDLLMFGISIVKNN